MTTSRVGNPVVRRALRGVALWILGEAALVLVARLAARRVDRGNEASTEIRRLLVMTGEELRPTAAALSQVRIDAVMGGAQLDLTALSPPPGGIDVTLRALMGGIAVRVPQGMDDVVVVPRGDGRHRCGRRYRPGDRSRRRRPAGARSRGHGRRRHRDAEGLTGQQKPGVPCQATSAGAASSRSTLPSISP